MGEFDQETEYSCLVDLVPSPFSVRIEVRNDLGVVRLPNGNTLTAQAMQELIDRTDSDKLKKARERLTPAAEPEIRLEGKA